MPQILNSPFELGVRMVFLLLALHPRKADLQRLVYLDYAAIYSSDLGGPQSLHTPVPLRGAEYLSRREVIEEGLYLMSMRDLVDVAATAMGIQYGAGENATSLVGLIGGPYAKALLERSYWAAKRFSNVTDQEMEAVFGSHGALWGAQFIGPEQTGAQ